MWLFGPGASTQDQGVTSREMWVTLLSDWEALAWLESLLCHQGGSASFPSCDTRADLSSLSWFLLPELSRAPDLCTGIQLCFHGELILESLI